MCSEKAENYKNEIKKIFSEWSKNRTIKKFNRDNIIITDGIVNPKIWFLQNERLLFILKEAYDRSSSNKEFVVWDELDYMLNECETNAEMIRSKTWKRIAQWSHCVFDGSFVEKPKWKDSIFQKIALMNIKKYDGFCPSDNDNLEQHSLIHSDLLYKELKLIDPTIIICGYTGWLLDNVFKENGLKSFRSKKNKSYHYTIELNNHTVSIIDFWHPSCRNDDKIMFEKLKQSLSYNNLNINEEMIEIMPKMETECEK